MLFVGISLPRQPQLDCILRLSLLCRLGGDRRLGEQGRQNCATVCWSSRGLTLAANVQGRHTTAAGEGWTIVQRAVETVRHLGMREALTAPSEERVKEKNPVRFNTEQAPSRTICWVAPGHSAIYNWLLRYGRSISHPLGLPGAASVAARQSKHFKSHAYHVLVSKTNFRLPPVNWRHR